MSYGFHTHSSQMEKSRVVGPISIGVFMALLAGFGLWLYGQAAGYAYLSPEHTHDILTARLWILLCLGGGGTLLYALRKRPAVAWAGVALVSAYFVVLYGLLFRGTEYGMNGHWGDNGNRLAEICKMMAYDSLFQDWYLKDLPSFYPPMWFWLMGLYAKALSIEAYQTIKYGYLLVFLVYPWLLYWSWRKLVEPIPALGVVVATIFFAHRQMNWFYYEHLTLALFLPWWLYYVIDAREPGKRYVFDWRFYLPGALVGAALFMTYYYWHFLAIVAAPISLIVTWSRTRSWGDIRRELIHYFTLGVVIALGSAVYWLPLARRVWWWGIESVQTMWFRAGHAGLTRDFETFSWEVALILVGACGFFLLRRAPRLSSLWLLIPAGLTLLIIDRVSNLWQFSIQTRKLQEFMHVFAAAPAALGVFFTIQTERMSSIGRGIALAFCAIGVIAMTENHMDITSEKMYRVGLGQRVPERDVAVFREVGSRDNVFLTTHYLEACYEPYYLFIPLNNMTAHIAGRYTQREGFLVQAAKIADPTLLAYVFAYNRYSPIDFVYLPLSGPDSTFEISLWQNEFDSSSQPHRIAFMVSPLKAPETFARLAPGVFAFTAPSRGDDWEKLLGEAYPDIVWHLRPRK